MFLRKFLKPIISADQILMISMLLLFIMIGFGVWSWYDRKTNELEEKYRKIQTENSIQIQNL